MNKLNIYYNKIQVGTLSLKPQSNDIDLKYDDIWKQNGFSLSPLLPLDGNFTNNQVKNFIENLLPEGNGLDMLVSYLQISKTNKFALLTAIGRDLSGALDFIIPNTNDIKTTFREVPTEELAQRIRQRKEMPISVWDNKPRISIAGVQEKLPITKLNGKYGFGEGKLSSTHILKFDKKDENLVLNEYLSLHLAKIAGLDVAKADIKYFENEQVLEVERFDRKIISDQEIQKIHIIDACQSLCLPVSYKYERIFGSGRDVKDIREGISFEKLQLLVNRCTIPLIENKKILEWTIINLCLGNSDAHGKNISFFKDHNGIKITPFYDIVNITLYENKYEIDLAMAINDEFKIDKIASYDLMEFCDEISTNMNQFRIIFKKISTKILNEFNSNFIEELKKKDKIFVNKYINNVENRIKQIEKVVKIGDY
jgi:serine/threonine-protein kinase HipA